MARTPLDLDELVEHWTLLKDEQALVSGKRGATRLGFAVLLKFYTQYGRFPRNRAELPGEAVEFVARQVQVPASKLGFYDWTGARSSTTVRRSGSTSASVSAASRTRRS
ncbi:DUF4158 domain-containing protein [Streptomyces sp. TG1A-8]|uniref:DUF4158 domain-containing protein n=1 Tax=Streptomyces sp. TG1A-8 TaxID=3051385 RepID=UPI00265C823F|nr:DUF4158 domain-containing protein [Streptomyces sp. TG1A-8]MDO0926165.1 DUF4158 domain-containing protein [Streptomyces sp. TG1A-8]